MFGTKSVSPADPAPLNPCRSVPAPAPQRPWGYRVPISHPSKLAAQGHGRVSKGLWPSHEPGDLHDLLNVGDQCPQDVSQSNSLSDYD